MSASLSAQLNLNSPSEQIIGTPYPPSSPKFEYPFPVLANSSSSSSSSSSLVSSSRTSPSIPSTPPVVPLLALMHPKMRNVSPPIPPSLLAKQNSWRVGLLKRKSSDDLISNGSGSSMKRRHSLGSVDPGSPSGMDQKTQAHSSQVQKKDS